MKYYSNSLPISVECSQLKIVKVKNLNCIPKSTTLQY